MTTWLLAAAHRAHLREIIAAAGRPREAVPLEPVLITCPRCALEYFADLALGEESLTLEADEWAARARLDRECPDHAHRSTVEA